MISRILLLALLLFTSCNQNVTIKTQDKTPSAHCYPLLKKYLAQGYRHITIYLWSSGQRIPALSYATINSKGYTDADILIEVSKKNIKSGDIIDGRIAIRYYFYGACLP